MNVNALMLLVHFIVYMREGVVFYKMDPTCDVSYRMMMAEATGPRLDQLLADLYRNEQHNFQEHYQNESEFVAANRINFMDVGTMNKDLWNQAKWINKQSK